MIKDESKTVTFSIREERLKASEELKKKSVKDKVMESAKNHFEEIFNRR